MVDILGHVAIGLLLASLSWFLWDSRISLAFIGFVLLTVLLPDIDLYLPGLVHHGITHTVLFVTVSAVVVGLGLAELVNPVLRRWWLWSEGHPVTNGQVRIFLVSGLLLGGVSHVFADFLSAPDGGGPVKPFWPFFSNPFSIDLVYYSNPIWNEGLLVIAVVIHLGLWYFDRGLASRRDSSGDGS